VDFDWDESDWARPESAGLEPGKAGLVCAAAATAKNEEIKITRKILCMLYLTTLDLIPPDVIVYE